MTIERSEESEDSRQVMIDLLMEDTKKGGVGFYNYVVRAIELKTQGGANVSDPPLPGVQLMIKTEHGRRYKIEISQSGSTYSASAWEVTHQGNLIGNMQSFWGYGDGSRSAVIKDCPQSSWDEPSTAEDVGAKFEEALDDLGSDNWKFV
jgi:hypothetical protein